MNLEQFKGYTPGPWWHPPYALCVKKRKSGLTKALVIGDFGGYCSPEENLNNAKLSAAAPELLDYARKLEAENERLREALEEIAEGNIVGTGTAREALQEVRDAE